MSQYFCPECGYEGEEPICPHCNIPAESLEFNEEENLKQETYSDDLVKETEKENLEIDDSIKIE